MATVRKTPDSLLVTVVAIETRIAQLEADLLKTQDPNDTRQLNARIKMLRARLAAGDPSKTAVHPNLLISKKDLE